MAKQRLVQIDADTGEVLDGFVAYVAPKRRNAFKRWLAMDQDSLELLAKSDLKGEDFRVFLALIARLDFENLLVLNQAEVAKSLGIVRNNVNRSIKRLAKLGVLIEGPRIGRSRSYRLNPNFGWKGSAKNHLNQVISLEEARRRFSGLSEETTQG